MNSEHNNSPLPRSRRKLIPLVILAVLGIGAVVAGAAIWWANRPIQATVLTPPEKTALENKLAAVEKAAEEPNYTPGDKTKNAPPIR